MTIQRAPSVNEVVNSSQPSAAGGAAAAPALAPILESIAPLPELSEFGLVGLAPIVELVKTIIWTGQVAGERPASAIICAPIGSGKTSVLEKLQTDSAQFFSDFTSIQGREAIRNEKLTHIMIGDLLSILGHKTGTVKLSLNILAKMTGDRVVSDPWTGEAIAPRRLGVITGVPPDALHSPKLKEILWASGFASRFIIVKYDYRKETIAKIHAFIRSDAYTSTRPFLVNVERGQFEVKISSTIAEKIELLAHGIKNDTIGARAHHHLRALVKARARMRKSNCVENEDFETIRNIADFFTSDGRTI